MNAMAPGARRNVLLFSAVAEAGTGLLLFLAPDVLVRWLFGGELSGTGLIFARCFAVAMVSLGLAPAFRTLVIYNALIALYLAYLGASRQGERSAAVAGGRAPRCRGAPAGLDRTPLTEAG